MKAPSLYSMYFTKIWHFQKLKVTIFEIVDCKSEVIYVDVRKGGISKLR